MSNIENIQIPKREKTIKRPLVKIVVDQFQVGSEFFIQSSLGLGSTSLGAWNLGREITGLPLVSTSSTYMMR
jgi:hypothetical protein